MSESDEVLGEPLDEYSLSILHELRTVDRPTLASPVSEGEDNVYVKYDLPKWREQGIRGEIWEDLKSGLLEAAVAAAGGAREAESCSSDDFEGVRRWETRNVPGVVEGAMEAWKGYGSGRWTMEGFCRAFPDINFRFSDTHGAMVTFATYYSYATSPLLGLADDSPLAVYDSEFGDDDSTSCLLDDYEVPACFGEDLFLLAEGTRPPSRWILIGSERSGTGPHIDPLWTNAWVSLMSGKKLWCLFPKGTPGNLVGVEDGKPRMSSSVWFKNIFPSCMSPEFPSSWSPTVVVQSPGQTVFVPNGWYHVVLNLEPSVAVTHNYASEHGPFERMWEEVRDVEPDFAARWRDGIRRERQHLEDRILRFEELDRQTAGEGGAATAQDAAA